MTITEAGRLAMQLVSDPATATCAALARWSHPMSREGLLLVDLFDRVSEALIEKPTPHWLRPTTPRPVQEIDHDAVNAALRLTGHLPAA